MVNLKDIIDILILKFSSICPKAHSYIEFVPNNALYPAFLYSLIYDKGIRESFMTSENKILVRVEYLKGESYDETYCEEMFRILTEAKQFLNAYILEVGKRNLKFDYIINKTKEGNLSFIIIFNFKDTVKDKNFEQSQKQIPAEKFIYNQKELI